MQAWTVLILIPGGCAADACLRPSRPFVPSDSQAVRDYEIFIRQDFETYIAKIQDYFRCIDLERASAFEEAKEVTGDYNRFVQLLGE